MSEPLLFRDEDDVEQAAVEAEDLGDLEAELGVRSQKQERDASKHARVNAAAAPARRTHAERRAAGEEVDSDEEEDDVESVEKKEFMAVKPWVGAIVAPSGATKKAGDQDPPHDTLELEFVYGYRGKDCRNNLFYTDRGELVYFASGVGIVYNKQSHTQRFFRGHTDDILCLDINPVHKNIVCSGQIGAKPFICVWNTDDCRELARLEGFHQRGVPSVRFSNDGTKIVSVGDDDDHTVAVWNWQQKRLLGSGKADKNKVLDVVYAASGDNFVTLGVKHIKFWSMASGALTAKRGVLGQKGTIQTILCGAFNHRGDFLTGQWSGEMYIWRGPNLIHKSRAHNGPVFSIFCTSDGVITGGKDGKVCLWDQQLKPLRSLVLNVVPRSVCVSDTHILLGTATNDIVELDRTSFQAQRLLDSHFNEMWGLAVHPSLPLALTCADDSTLRLWNITSRRMVAKQTITGTPSDASSVQRPIGASRAAAFSPDGKLCVVGREDGGFAVYEVSGLKKTVEKKDRNRGISDIKFSPDGSMLAVGSHSDLIDIYNTATWQRQGTCRGHSSYITHIDWSSDGQVLQSNCGAYELLFWTNTGQQITSATSLRDVTWATQTCVLGWGVQGIWPPCSDGTDVNAVDRSKSGKLLVTADDFGLVKLFKYPVYMPKVSRFNEQHGHCSHVTNARWLYDDSIVITVGGLDACVFQWRHRA